MTNLGQLTEAVQSVAPACVGLAVLRPDRASEPHWVVITSQGRRVRVDGITPGQVAGVQSLLDSWDWSAAAAADRDDAKNPDRTLFRARVDQVISSNNAFAAIATPTAAEQREQLKRVTDQLTLLFKLAKQMN